MSNSRRLEQINKITLYLIRFGIVTLTVNKWSPRIDGLFSFGEPFFARTSTSPGWVPGGICSSVIPSTVCTCLDVKNSIISVWIQHTNKKLRGKKKEPFWQ
jgi:hypothetical protein